MRKGGIMTSFWFWMLGDIPLALDAWLTWNNDTWQDGFGPTTPECIIDWIEAMEFLLAQDFPF
jgi:hypothetical protein